MTFIREFWTGLFLAAIGGSVGFATATWLSISLGWHAITPVVVAAGAAGFLLGATAVEIYERGVRAWASQYFGIDLRGLAVLRIGLALAILIDLAMRARDMTAHYSDAGILPLEIRFYRPSVLSLHLLTGDARLQALLFTLAAVFALLLLIGYHTRIMTIVSWLLLVSLHNRNPLVLTGGDTMLRMLIFWSMFLPLGAKYSIDAARNVSLSIRRTRFADAATFALLLQMACIYGFSGLLKSHNQWHVDGSATYYALSLDMLTTQIGRHLLEYPRFLRASTFGVIYLELFAPLLIFMPWRNAAIRLALFVMLFSLHFGFQICMWIGVFPLVGMVAAFVMLPSAAWDAVDRLLATPARRNLVLYYDASSRFSRRLALMLRTFWFLPHARIRRAATREEVQREIDRQPCSIVVQSGGNLRSGFDGVLMLLRHAPLIWPLAWIVRLWPLGSLGHWKYRWFATHPAWADRLTGWMRMRRQTIKPFWPIQPLPVVFIIYVMLYNLTSLPDWDMSWFKGTGQSTTFDVAGKRFKMDGRTIYNVGRHLRLDQNWTLFAPHPLMGDGWFVAKGTLASGKTVDVRTGRPYTFDKPAEVAHTYPNNRWRKYLEKLRKPNVNPRFQLEYCRWWCRQWNATHSGQQRLRQIDLYYVRENSRPPYEPLTPTPLDLKRCDCES